MSKTSLPAHGTTEPSRRQNPRPIASWEEEREREVRESLALLHARRKAERREHLRERLVTLWPLWCGLLLGLLSPVIASIAAAINPWCMALAYPFVVLAKRPEIQVGPVTHVLPAAMLYIQFPIEGWLACIILKRRIRPLSVAVHVMLFHFLGVAELLLLSAGAGHFLRR